MKKYLFIFFSILTGGGLLAQTNEFVVHNETNTLQFAGSNNAFKCIGVGDSVYWAGTQYRGLYRYDTASKVWVKSSQLSNVFINDIKRDSFGGVWIAQSGTSGTIGGGSNTAGGVNYFPNWTDGAMQFYSVVGTTTGGGIKSRNVRSIYVNPFYKRTGIDSALPRVWAVEATFISSSNTVAGGVSVGLNATANYFNNRSAGLQVTPYVSTFLAGTPSCEAVGGNKDEIWVSTRQNFGLSKILRYNPKVAPSTGGIYIGAYDSTVVKGGIFPPGFRAHAIFFDSEGRRWLGLQNGGLRVWEQGYWTIVNMESIFPLGTQVNNNAITEDDLGNVYIGTSTGLLRFDGSGNVDDIFRYTKYTTADELPSNNITGLAYDKAKGRMLLATDAGIVFWTVKSRIDVSLQWDYSFPDREGKPRGVAADGIARVYIKVKRGDSTLPAISTVNLSLHEYVDADSSTRGRFKAATVLNQYSEEATGANNTDITLIDNIKPKEFWAWYVAPTDYSRDEAGPDANTSGRADKIRVIVTYVNSSKDTLVYDKLRVVRPPLLLVHGLASGPETWDNLRHGGTIYFKNSPRFKYVHALTMNGRALFKKNAILLMSGDNGTDTAKGRTNTLQGNIEQIRKMGYAANQVDYVCHSMGGIMIRNAIDKLGYKFYAGAGSPYKYKNYNRGFTHKIIFVNTPHNSSILGDGVDEFIPLAPEWVNVMMRAAFLASPGSQKPFDFIQPANPDNLLTTTFKASDAVNNLQITNSRGGVNLAETKAKFHMITGNVALLDVQTTTILAELDPTIEYATNILKCMINTPFLPANVKAILRPMLVLANAARVFTFFEWYSRNLGYPDYLAESDLIVPLASEHARIDLPGAKPYITMYLNSPGSNHDASHIHILGRQDVGQRIYNLLNTKLYSPQFGDVIKANIDPEPGQLQPRGINAGSRPQNILAADSIYYDTTKIKIDLPVTRNNSFVDSIMNIKFRLKDTANLAYVNIRFQVKDTFSLSKTKVQQTVTMKPYAEYPGTQKLWAVAAYFRPDNGVTYYIDTFSVTVKNNAPLQGFRVNGNPLTITGGENYYPPYQVQYNNKWVMLPATDSNVTVSFDPVGILTRIDSTKALKVLNEGFTEAIFSYNGFADTIVINAEMPLDSFCVNKTIAAGSFKNPAIWSKKVVPDFCDSVVIQHAVSLDTSIQFRAARINAAASFTLNNAAITAQLGANTEGTSMIDNYGTLTIQNGNLDVQGRVKHNSGSTFNMSGGTLKLDGNAGDMHFSVPNGTAIFEAAAGMASFNFSGGNLQIVDPPYGDASQTLNCPYDFGNNSTLTLGANTSSTSSKNPDGFGGLQFPNKIGRLIINAGTRNGNRQFVNKKALNVKGSAEVRTGSGIILQAPITVNQ